jgi:hypothetical protein
MELYNNCKITHIQAKLYVSNHFRKNADIINPEEIDDLVQKSYDMLMELEWHYAREAYIFR